ncbi:MAG: amidase family protein, partial [Betaproteobacteria bacterium]|nr:amidase family protein [Betaproteobacteria bacterium]
LAQDAFDIAGDAISRALDPALKRVSAALGAAETVTVAQEGLAQWFQVFRVLQGAEVWAQHGEWVNRVKPRFGAGVKERMDWVATIDPARVGPAKVRREEIARRMETLLADGAVLVLPTVPGIAPLKNRPSEETDDIRARAMSLLSIAGLARLPQVSLPLARAEGCPLGLSLVAARGADAMLLALARKIAEA